MGEETLVILAHGGTQMAAMERYALPHADYYHWCAPQRGRLRSGCRRLGGAAGAAPAENCAVHKGGCPMIEYAVLGGFVLDCLLGDPAWLPHPVVYMGKAISALEKRLRARLPKNASGGTAGRCHCGLLPAGGHLSADEPCLPGGCPYQPVAGAGRPDVLVRAGTGRKGAGAGEHQCLPETGQARPACRPQGGQPHRGAGHPGSTLEGVTRAAVETVAENASDGVIAPLLYMLIGGAPLALTYKAINTMDSMLGYKNEKIPLLWPHPCQAGRCGKLPSQPPCRPAVGGCRGLYAQ